MWGENENGAYRNCIRFAAGIIRKNTMSDGSFTAESLIRLNANMADYEKVVLEEIRSIRIILEKSILTPDKYKNFETDYLINLKRKNEKISLFGSGINERKYRTYNVEPSYVQLYCVREEKFEEQLDSLELDKLLKRETIVWLKGEAGGGKTTFIQWLAVKAASDMKNTNNSIGGLVPVVIKLREANFPIDYESEINKVTASIGKHCPDEYFFSLINSDKLLLLIDGLDEVTVEAQGQIIELVDSLYNKLKENAKKRQQRDVNSRIIITTRPYVEDDLESEHGCYMITRMRMAQIKTFVYFWHKAVFENEYSEDELKKRADSVLSRISNSHGIRSIAGTPLLCAMICVLYYYNNGEVPEKRGELYEQCCRMLIYSRDKERKIEDNKFGYLEYTSQLTIIQDIAVYMLRSGKTEVNKLELLEHMRALYKDRTLISDENDRNNPGPLLDYLIRRTGVIREPSIGKIDFIHKTFLEFLAAESLKNSSSWGEIENNVTDEFWKETIIMCFWKTSCENASRMLSNFIERYKKTANDEIIFMASMCAHAATNIEISLQKEIEGYLSDLIPPSKQNVVKLSQAGGYVLPFLSNRSGFTVREKHNCIETLANISYEDINIEEYLSVVYTYLQADETYEIKKAAWNSICEIPEEILHDNDIEKVLCEAFLLNNQRVITIPSTILGVIEEIEDKLEIDKLIVVIEHFGDYYNECEIGNNFKVCKNIFGCVREIELKNVDYVFEVEWIDEIKGVKGLSLTIHDDSEAIITCLNNLKIGPALEKIVYDSYNLSYISNTDISKLIHLKELILHLYSPDLEFCLDSFDSTPELSRVEIDLNPRVIEDIYYSITDLKDKYQNIEISVK